MTGKQGVLSRLQEFFSNQSAMTPQEESLVFKFNEDVPSPTTEKIHEF